MHSIYKSSNFHGIPALNYHVNTLLTFKWCFYSHGIAGRVAESFPEKEPLVKSKGVCVLPSERLYTKALILFL